MASIKLGWWMRLGLAGCARLGKRTAFSTSFHRAFPINMATAHGVFVIEVDAEDPTQTETIARALIEPIRDDYTEILVYVTKLGDESDLPARRMRWTPRGGYVEITYAQPELDR